MNAPRPRRVERSAIAAWLVGLLLVGLGSACSSVTPPSALPGVSDVYFTRAHSLPGSTLRNINSTPYQVYPTADVFDRAQDSRITLVIVLKDGSPQTFSAALTSPGAGAPPRPTTWSPVGNPQFNTWRTSTIDWPITAVMAPGRYTVDLMIDDRPASIRSS